MFWQLPSLDGEGGGGLPCVLPLHVDGLLPLQVQELLQGGGGGGQEGGGGGQGGGEG